MWIRTFLLPNLILAAVLGAGDPASAQGASCRTIGYVLALAEAAQRNPERDGNAADRLRRLSSRNDPGAITDELRSQLPPGDLRMIESFLYDLQRRDAGDPLRSDPDLLWSAQGVVRLLGPLPCQRVGSQATRSSGNATADSGADSEDGRIFERRKREGWLTTATFKKIAIGAAIMLAVAAAFAAFRHSKIRNRRHRRHTCGMDCTLTFANDRVYSARLIDLSEGGCRIGVSNKDIETGEPVALKAGKQRLDSEVRWTSKDAIGVSFVDLLGHATLDALLSEARILRTAQRRRRRRSKVKAS